jgi:hypothetical protein
MAGDEERRTESTEESWWKVGPLLVIFALGGIVVGVVICWIAGLFGAMVLGEPFGLDLIGYHEPETAGIEDHVRYVVMGAVILGLTLGGYVGFERLSNWLDDRRWRRERDARDLARYRQKEAEREEAKARRRSGHLG